MGAERHGYEHALTEAVGASCSKADSALSEPCTKRALSANGLHKTQDLFQVCLGAGPVSSSTSSHAISSPCDH
eukprot:5369072-Pleurochrysis_carterae.AAC.6